jgi:hypothetical protein
MSVKQIPIYTHAHIHIQIELCAIIYIYECDVTRDNGLRILHAREIRDLEILTVSQPASPATPASRTRVSHKIISTAAADV